MESSQPNAVGGRRRIVRLAAILNLAYFGVEFAVALAIGSVSLFADSIDFLEDTAVNLLILLALDCSKRTARYIPPNGLVGINFKSRDEFWQTKASCGFSAIACPKPR